MRLGNNANAHTNPIPGSEDPAWYFLVEWSLSELLSYFGKEAGIAPGWSFQTMCESGVPPEWVENIEIPLTAFAKEALAHFKQGRLELPGYIRIFCQKKIGGGWGYFLVERSADSSTGSSEGPPHFIDLYLYKEGE